MSKINKILFKKKFFYQECYFYFLLVFLPALWRGGGTKPECSRACTHERAAAVGVCGWRACCLCVGGLSLRVSVCRCVVCARGWRWIAKQQESGGGAFAGASQYHTPARKTTSASAGGAVRPVAAPGSLASLLCAAY